MAVTRKAWFLRLARRYVRWKLARTFDGVRIAGLDEVRRRVAHGPLIVAANHVCWWDTFLLVLLDELLDAESYCLMEAQQLGRLPFFGWVGAIPIDGRSPATRLASLRAAIGQLDRPGRILWIFPQAQQRPAHLRPLGLQRGVELLASRTGAPVVPLALRYDFRDSPKAEINMVFDPALDNRQLARGALLHQVEASIVEGLARIDRHLLTPDDAFVERLTKRKTSVVPLGGKVLAMFSGRRSHG
jgi:1-acyl-sn-glycerol-3-phosphate acyltransferase